MNRELRHLTDRELQLAADGELSKREASALQRHLAFCWACRGRMAERERLLEDFALAQERWLDSRLPPLAVRQAALAERLSHVSRDTSPGFRQSLLARMVSLFRPPTWTAVATAAGVAILWFIATLNPPGTQAQTMLARARRAQEATGKAHRATRIRARNREWTARASWGGVRPPVPEDLEAALRRASVDFSDPLSAASFAAWRQALAQPQDRVTTRDRRIEIFTADASGGPIVSESLVLRAEDYWPVARRVVFRSGDEVTMQEIAAPAFAPPVPAIPASRSTAMPRAEAGAGNTHPAGVLETELAADELAARIAVHAAGADHGDDVTIHRSATAVIVRVRVDDEVQAERIRQALSGVAHVRADVGPYPTVIAGGRIARPAQDPSERVAARPAWAQTLEERFPDARARAAYVNSVLDRSREALVASWALRRLAERYTPTEMDLLSSNGKRDLRMLIDAERVQAAAAITALRSLMAGFVEPSAPVAESAADWHASALRLNGILRGLHSDVLQAYAGAHQADPDGHALAVTIGAGLAAAPVQLAEIGRSLSQIFDNNTGR